MDVTTVAGAEALRGLFKYRTPRPRQSSDVLRRHLVAAVQECRFQVNVEAMEERGRPAPARPAVMLIEGDRWPKPSADAPPVLLKSAEELFGGSDRPRYGNSRRTTSGTTPRFPNHPLSQVRTRLVEVAAVRPARSGCRSLSPSRIKRGWRLCSKGSGRTRW